MVLIPNEQPSNSNNSVPKITKIETQKRKGRYNIYLDEEYAFPVDEAVLVKHVLFKGMEITKEFQQQLEKEDDFSKAFSRAVNYLSYSLRSEKEVRDDLEAHEFSLETAVDVIEKLKEMKYINDLTYAESYTRTAANLNGKGPYNIRQELKKRGIKETIIEQALLEYPIEQRVENGVAVAKKVLKRAKQSSSKETTNKVRQGLMQKGFNNDEITEILDQVDTEKDEDDEYEALKKQGEKIWRKQSKLEGSKKIQKVKASLYQKGFNGDLINQFMNEKEFEDE
ncbi:recombination regulator RecX [Desemzia sp. RIT804]|uniref:recombination regulator RecX n=1 Tax=Desemzia sp. RIT 804 TaxID=2810209 RepID=UPI0019501FEE|nr:recombination regulator RecX [Desemzia sp. RIT 804]MBM6615904.1 recombination regulator RecX [Desemzia sp. RIT 804]